MATGLLGEDSARTPTAAASCRTFRDGGVRQVGFLATKEAMQLDRSPAYVALRIYHVWCILSGLAITVLLIVQAFLALNVGLFGPYWVDGSQARKRNIAAACLLSVLLLSWASSLCHAGILLVRDAARMDAFLVYRALILGDSVNSRLGLPAGAGRRAFDPRRDRRDLWVQIVALYLPLDVLPLLAAVASGSMRAWLAWVSTISLLEILVFWLLVCINDYRGKVRALKVLLKDRRSGAASLSQLPAQDVASFTPSVAEDSQEEKDELRASSNIWVLLCNRLLGQPWWAIAIGACFVCVAGLATRQLFTIFVAFVVAIFAALYLIQRHCVPRSQLSLSAVVVTEEDKGRLISCLDEQYRLRADLELGCCRNVFEGLANSSNLTNRVVVPMGAQLVDDVGIPGACAHQLQGLPLGSAVAFRLQKLGPWDEFLETHCGGSPDQILRGNFIWLFCGVVICSSLVATRHMFAAMACFAGVLLLISPSLCLAVAPGWARWCHALVSLLVSLLALVFGMLAAAGHSALLFCAAPLLCVGSHFLLHRKIRHMHTVALLFSFCFALVVNTFFSVSIAALEKGELETPHFSNGKFHFSSRGRMQRQGMDNFSSVPCSISYATTDDSLSLTLVDFAMLNKLVYFPKDALGRYLKLWLPRWELVREQRRETACRHDDEDCNSGDWTSWFVFRGSHGTPLANTTVLTIRGTKTFLDYIVDMDFWSAAVLLQLVENVAVSGPPASAFLSSPLAKRWFAGKKVHYGSVLRYLRSLKLHEHPEQRVYITGHSLGGGIANLVGAEIGIPSVAFSPPGVQTTAELLGLDLTKLHALALDIVPDEDPIVRATGKHGTVKLPISCAARGAQCHRIFNTACELMDMCGDQARPQRAIPCDFCPAKLRQHPEIAPDCT